MDADHTDEEEMDDKAENPKTSLIYTNWRGKTFLIDEEFCEWYKGLLVEEGLDYRKLDYITPEWMMEILPVYEDLERMNQLELIWEMPEAKKDR